MGELRCVDGSILTVLPVPCRDRAGKPYEITLELRRDGQPFARVGERCGFRLSRLAARVSAARPTRSRPPPGPIPMTGFLMPGTAISPGRCGTTRRPNASTSCSGPGTGPTCPAPGNSGACCGPPRNGWAGRANPAALEAARAALEAARAGLESARAGLGGGLQPAAGQAPRQTPEQAPDRVASR